MKTRGFLLTLVLAACMLLAIAGCSPASQPAHTAALEPGVHSIEVHLEGGTGRASVKSPCELTVAEDGSMTATIVWSSSHYDQMVIDGVQYLPITTEGGSTFQIPVAALDEDLPVKAETTAMSEPHMIDYTLRFGVGFDEEGPAPDSAASITDFHNPDLGNGWTPTGSLELQYATQYTVDYFDGGYKLACLSDGARYLVVPEGADVPEGLASDIVVLQQPLGDIYLVASDTMCLFDALDAIDTITVSGIAKDNWYIPAAVKAMEDGRIAYGGKYSTPDYDTLLVKKVRLAIESTMINHTPDVREKLIELGIPVLTERSSYESEPLGRTEWVKFYGALLNKEEQAKSLFEAQVAAAGKVEGAKTGKTVAFFYINSNGAAVVRKPGDYVTKMIELAGGEYIFNSLGEGSSAMSTVTLEMERFYAQAKDADIIVYNGTIDAGVNSIDDLVRKNELLANFKAVQDGNVWVTEQNMYQQMMNTGNIIGDFYKVFLGDEDALTYLHKVA